MVMRKTCDSFWAIIPNLVGIGRAGHVARRLPAAAQVRDPVYAGARGPAGQIGEQVNGYLGFVTPPGRGSEKDRSKTSISGAARSMPTRRRRPMRRSRNTR